MNDKPPRPIGNNPGSKRDTSPGPSSQPIRAPAKRAFRVLEELENLLESRRGHLGNREGRDTAMVEWIQKHLG